jgi:hypothetical protein
MSRSRSLTTDPSRVLNVIKEFSAHRPAIHLSGPLGDVMLERLLDETLVSL